jgi:N-acetylmuramoyl-L-alanine amidase
MALRREWKPVSHYSTGRSPVRLIVLHTTEGAQTKESLYNWFANPSSRVSSHVGIDNRSRVIHEYVKRHHSAWAQGNYNGVAICVEQCTPAGAANGWSRDYWLNSQSLMLSVTAEWIAEEAKAYGLPITRLTAAQAQGSGRGVCGHVDIQPQDRTDPGRNYPWDRVLEMARGFAGGAPAPQPPQPQPPEPAYYGEDDMALVMPDGVQVNFPWTGRNEFSAVNLGGDAGGTPEGRAVYRVAAHKVGTSDWVVTNNVTITGAGPRQVVEFAERDAIDLVSIRWVSGAKIAIMPAFKRRGT